MRYILNISGYALACNRNKTNPSHFDAVLNYRGVRIIKNDVPWKEIDRLVRCNVAEVGQA